MPSTLAQLSGRTTSPAYTGQEAAKALPKPQTHAQTVAYAALGLVLLGIIFAAVIWFQRQHSD